MSEEREVKSASAPLREWLLRTYDLRKSQRSGGEVMYGLGVIHCLEMLEEGIRDREFLDAKVKKLLEMVATW